MKRIKHEANKGCKPNITNKKTKIYSRTCNSTTKNIDDLKNKLLQISQSLFDGTFYLNENERFSDINDFFQRMKKNSFSTNMTQFINNPNNKNNQLEKKETNMIEKKDKNKGEGEDQDENNVDVNITIKRYEEELERQNEKIKILEEENLKLKKYISEISINKEKEKEELNKNEDLGKYKNLLKDIKIKTRLIYNDLVNRKNNEIDDLKEYLFNVNN